VYFVILLVFAAWGCMAIWLARPAFLIVVGANIGALIFAISGVHVVITNYRFLPREIRPPLWRVIAVFACVAFYSFFLVMTLIHWKW
jgi:hypothetical protein